MKNQKTQYMAFMALFIAIEIVLVVTPLGFFPIGPINATTMHIPVIIAGITLGKKAGAQLGFVFGLTSLLNATFRPLPTSFVFSPFITFGGMQGNWASILIAFVPRILIGFMAGLLYEKMQKRNINNSTSIITASLVGAITNTVLVLGGIYVFFGPSYAEVTHVAYNTLLTVLLGIIATNGIAEAALGAVVCLIVCKAIAPSLRKYKFSK